MTRRIRGLGLCLALLFTGCGTHDIYVGTAMPNRGVIARTTHHGFAWGWINSDIVVDGNAITWAKTDVKLEDGLLRLITLGIYWPTTVKYRYAQDVREAPQPGAPAKDDPRFYPTDERKRWPR